MGNCSGRKTLNRENDADVDKISGKARNFCTLSGVGGDSIRTSFCRTIGDREWTTLGSSSHYSCQYNWSNNASLFTGTGCCDGDCPIAGSGVDCTRVAYRGQKRICCFRDGVCSGSNSTPAGMGGFDSDEKNTAGNYAKNRSCPPENRRLDSPACQDDVYSLCTDLDAQNPNPNWRANWLTTKTLSIPYNTVPDGGNTSGTLTWTSPANSLCTHALYRNVYGPNNFGCLGESPPIATAGVQYPPTATGLVYGRKLVSGLMQTYTSQGGNVAANESQQGDTQLNQLIFDICTTIPGVCSDTLATMCSTVSTTDLINNNLLQKWCGCHMAPIEYAKYSNLYRINKECTPMCNIAGNIPAVDSSGVNALRCKQSTCVIDNVSIDLQKSRVGDGGISFSQLCGSCGSGNADGNSGTCNCSIQNLNFLAVEAQIGSVEVAQQCGGSSVCSYESTDSSGKPTQIPIPCDSPLGYNPYAGGSQSGDTAIGAAERSRNTTIILIFAITIIILIVIWNLFSVTPIEDTATYYIPVPSIDPVIAV